MKHTSYKEAEEVMLSYGKTLTAYDFKPGDCVFILHQEGTTLFYKSAFLMEWKDWIFVYTEHHYYLAYHKTDLDSYWNLSHQEVKKLTGTPYVDTCEECGVSYSVDLMRYGEHVDLDKYKEGHLVVLCPECVETLE